MPLMPTLEPARICFVFKRFVLGQALARAEQAAADADAVKLRCGEDQQVAQQKVGCALFFIVLFSCKTMFNRLPRLTP